MNTPILETERLILRPFKENDAINVFELGQIEKPDWYRFAIVLQDTGALIGTALIYYEEEVECWEIGYNLGKKYWNKGYTTEVMKKIIDFAKGQLELSQIVGRYAKENTASGNVMDKLGFKYEKDIPYECNDGTVMREGIQCRLILE